MVMQPFPPTWRCGSRKHSVPKWIDFSECRLLSRLPMLVVGEQTSRLRGTWLSLIEREITHVQQYVDNRASSHQSKERTLGNIFRMSKPSIDTASSGGKVSAVEKPLSQQDVNHGALQNISQLEDSLWAAA